MCSLKVGKNCVDIKIKTGFLGLNQLWFILVHIYDIGSFQKRFMASTGEFFAVWRESRIHYSDKSKNALGHLKGVEDFTSNFI